MRFTIVGLLMIAALVLFILATLGVPSPPRFQWQPAGLACLTLVMILTTTG